ncbi:MAG: DUF4124 domain-containing protein [Piscirickettsiaceae bacterium]|nr:DUF4124 domain-containing protein [Piscirickettsiaceae bacterium]
MKKGNLVLLLLLVGTLAVGEIYKWVDESGKVHYGDSPPPEIDTQTIEIPRGPSREEVELERQRVRELMEQNELFSEENHRIVPPDKLSREEKVHAVTPDNIACFSPISNLVQGASVEHFTPITPTSLAKVQQELLNDFFGKIERLGIWRGSITELECWSGTSERNAAPIEKVKDFEVRMDVDWNKFESLLTLEADITDEPHLIYKFEVGDVLYFNDSKSSFTTALDGNKVEVLMLNQDMVSFLIKRRLRSGTGRIGPLRGEIRHIEVFDRTLKLIELYYLDGILASSRTWIFSR